MARWGKVEKETKQLISQITAFSADDENFGLCLQFALSNFKYHRFLDVDSHKISRAIEGIHTKFLVHSQDREALAFKTLTDKFLDSPVFENKKEGKTDTHYGLLSLLLTLADQPTTAVYTEKQRTVEQETEPEFDWAHYLLEGEDLGGGPFPESPVSSDDEPDLPVNADSGVSTSSHALPLVTFPEDEEEEDDDVRTDASSVTEKSWLSRNVVVQYWKGGRETSGGSHHSNNVSINMSAYLQDLNPLYIPPQSVTMTETQVLRETLWMLSSVQGSFLYIIQDKHITVRPDVNLRHLTQASLSNTLQTFIHHGNTVLNLQSFVHETCSNCYHSDVSNVPMVSQTYQAFAASLATYLNGYKLELKKMEEILIKQEETFTLACLQEELQPRFHELDVLSHVFTEGIETMAGCSSNSHCASHLLTVLYNAILDCDIFGMFNVELISLLLSIWVRTSKPFLDLIDNWITKGLLEDQAMEFIIQRNDKIQSVDENFWETAFTLHCTAELDSTIAETKTKQGVTRSMNNDLGNTSSEDLKQQSYLKSSWAPQFLCPVLNKVILTGKSMELLQSLGRLADVVQTGVQQKSLYTTFIESLQFYLGSTDTGSPSLNNDLSSSNDPRLPAQSNQVSVFSSNVAQQMLVKGTNDPLLRINFSAMFGKTEEKTSIEKDWGHCQSCLGNLQLSSLQPIQKALTHCLYPHIEASYHLVCTRLLDILKEEYHLLDYLAAMRKFYLMEAGDSMYDFYTELFDKLRLHEPWQDISLLNLTLQEAVREQFPQEVERLFVSVESPKDPVRNKHPITALDGLTLHYKVPWPVDIVINKRCQEVYNQVFTFLLQVKRAKYCLDQLRFIDLSRADPFSSPDLEESVLLSQEKTPKLGKQECIHHMHVFRMRLLHFANSLHNYIMTRILHSTGLEFQSDIEQATDLDEVIAIHNGYISKIYERCLLHKKVAFIKEAVTKVLNLTLHFQVMWDRGVDNISAKALKEMEAEFFKCIKFLSSFLNNVIKRGSFPHLESLAFSLITSSEQPVNV